MGVGESAPLRVSRVRLRDFRNSVRSEAELGQGLTLVCGPNGAGKTNLLEALHLGCVGSSCRTANERELVRHGQPAARVAVETVVEGTCHTLEVSVSPGHPKRLVVDGAATARTPPREVRPAVGVFMPERLELVKGAPTARRDHFDRVIAGVWPARAEARLAYSRALAQRNALLGRIRAGLARADSLPPWDAELARHGTELIANRSAVVELLAEPFRRHARELGLPEKTELSYRPRSHATEASQLAAELAERREADLERGFTSHGPHRDDVRLLHDERSLRVYGSQGQQRTAVLALLLAERDLLLERTGQAPLMLLDDVMSELDGDRRERLATALRAGGQAVVTATDPKQVPGSGEPGVVLVAVEAGSVRCDPAPSAGTERTLAA